MVEYLEEWRFGFGWIKELRERVFTKSAPRTEDCEGEGVYELKKKIKYEPVLFFKKGIPLTEVAVADNAERASLEQPRQMKQRLGRTLRLMWSKSCNIP